MDSRSNVLLVSNDEAETNILKSILIEHVTLSTVVDLLELQGILETSSYDAVFCGWSLRRGTWKDALGKIQRRYPELPVVVFCRTGGEQEWGEVMGAGAFDLLSTPYLKATVLAVLEQAVWSWERRRRQGGEVALPLIGNISMAEQRRSGRERRNSERRVSTRIYSGNERRRIGDRRYRLDRRMVSSVGFR